MGKDRMGRRPRRRCRLTQAAHCCCKSEHAWSRHDSRRSAEGIIKRSKTNRSLNMLMNVRFCCKGTSTRTGTISRAWWARTVGIVAPDGGVA